MADIVNAETRSRMMRSVRTQNTTPELRVRRFLHSAGLRYRLHVRGLAGSPDIVFPRYRTVVFVHGCFWHQHPGCSKAKLPATNIAFWTDKLQGNVQRDRRKISALRQQGWAAFVIWECQTRSDWHLKQLLESIQANG